MKALQIRLLGEFCVQVGPQLVPEAGWRRRKAADLIKLLALSPGQRLHREQVIELLWPELEPEAATNNLHRTLHYARRLLEPDLGLSRRPLYLCLKGEVIVLSPLAPVWTDVEAFWAAAAEARQARHPAAYEEALGLYPGELLPGGSAGVCPHLQTLWGHKAQSWARPTGPPPA